MSPDSALSHPQEWPSASSLNFTSRRRRRRRPVPISMAFEGYDGRSAPSGRVGLVRRVSRQKSEWRRLGIPRSTR